MPGNVITYKKHLYRKLLPFLLVFIFSFSLICPFENVSARKAPAGSVPVSEEFRGVWIAYYDFEKTAGKSKAEFSSYIDEMFDNIVSIGMNAVMVHVRPFGDAMYKSSYFPWSYYASGKQGKNPGYDPLQIMVTKAHDRNLEIHAWINPYRVSADWDTGTNIKKLAKSNPARKWLTSSKSKYKRYVLSQNGAYYYNPSIPAVRNLIVNGVKEIVENYDVDGIHFDDYFYPELGSEYATAFDAYEYNKYAKKTRKSGKQVLPIYEWRKSNVNELIRSVYSTVKSINKKVVFGISPAGGIDNLDDIDSGYVDYRTWMSESGYIDYICPQLYWSFNSKNIYPFYETLLKWIAAAQNKKVKVYVGLPAYKMNDNYYVSSRYQVTDTEFYNQYLLADMVSYIRRSGRSTGFIVFDYSDLFTEKNAEMTSNLKNEVVRVQPEVKG